MKLGTGTLLFLASACGVVQGRQSLNPKGWRGSWNGWNEFDAQRSNIRGRGLSSSDCEDDHLLQCSGFVGTVYGEPHITTFDGWAARCQAEGEFVLVNSDTHIHIQSRFDHLPTTSTSIITGMAVKVAGLDKIQVTFAEYESGDEIVITDKCPMHLYINGELQPAADTSGRGYDITIGSSSLDIQFYDKDDSPTYAISLQATYSNRGDSPMMAAYFCLPSSMPEMLEGVVGLLGSPNCDSTDEWMTATGEPLEQSGNGQYEYDYCTSHHCIYTEDVSLFVHEDDNGGKSFDDLQSCDEEFTGDVDISDVDDEILAICGEDNEDCLLDGVVAGVEGALSAASAQDNIVAMHGSNTTVDMTPDVSCAKDVALLQVTGSSEYDHAPITIVSQDTKTATLKLRTPFFTGTEVLYVRYDGENYASNCISKESVTTSDTEVFVASCPTSERFSIVNVIASDSSLDAATDTASVPTCCYGDDDSNPKVMYSFMISCVSQCPETAR
eukprot:Nitzschia sp. Nitz4//scaffold120_size68122//56453//57946//NITZ4_006054-RA/size68122-processed-gene-0.40-mRNA-1//1//CDS//3329534308//2070//frame0